MPIVHTMWKVSKHGFFSGLYFTALGLNTRISPYSVRIRKNTDQKKVRIGTLFMQCHSSKMLWRPWWDHIGVNRIWVQLFFRWEQLDLMLSKLNKPTLLLRWILNVFSKLFTLKILWRVCEVYWNPSCFTGTCELILLSHYFKVLWI